MTAVCELIMLICFGVSWPVSVIKSLKTKSTQGKSLIFMSAIIVGYMFGICGKIISNNVTYVLVIYLVNLSVVSFDLILYFINRKREILLERQVGEQQAVCRG